MSCTSSAAGSQQPSNAALTVASSQKGDGRCCSNCNSQLWSSYVVGLLACLLVVGGIFLAFHRWDYLWLAVSAVGVLLILIGASLHYCGGGGAGDRQTNDTGEPGSRAQKRKRGSNHHRIVCEVGNQNERLLPSAPSTGLTTSGHNFSVSQLSLNMLPPFFPSYDTVSLGPQVAGSPSVSPGVNPIMHLNGQSFLLLPLGGVVSHETPSESNSLVRRLSTHLAVLEQQSISQKRYPETVNFGTSPGLAPFGPLNPLEIQLASKPLSQQDSVLQTTTPTTADKVVTGMSATSPENDVNEIVIEDEAEDPIYQVPRSPLTAVYSSVPQNNLNSCDPSTIERFSPSPHPTVELVLSQATFETVPSEEVCTDITETPVQEDTLPNDTQAHSEETSVMNESQDNFDNRTSPDPLNVSEIHTESVSPQCESSSSPNSSHDRGSAPDSRITTPEPEWTLPPSYDEVAVAPQFKRLGHLKFAYETL